MTTLVKDDKALALLTTESNEAIAMMAEKFVGLDASKDYAAVAEALKCCREVRGKADKAKKSLNEDALNWQRTVNAEHKRIINAVRDIEDPLRASKAEVDEAEKRAKEEALRAMREKEARERREEEERLARERDAIEAEKRELAKAKAELEAAKAKLEPKPEPAPKPEPEPVVAAAPGTPDAISDEERDDLLLWFQQCETRAPKVKSRDAKAMIARVLSLVSKEKESLLPKRVKGAF